ncbi:unnamed protein product [Caenorhabditis angaria]|uniref:Uncharacterized protein n=1 Tax=Caenorhabditis angaria TaxID=860376 RepID=A0A9P1I7E2_9PELO|nr:unnamed protein product [Caenorhabditis angaria]
MKHKFHLCYNPSIDVQVPSTSTPTPSSKSKSNPYPEQNPIHIGNPYPNIGIIGVANLSITPIYAQHI